MSIEWIKTVRTTVQVVLALAASAPLLMDELGLETTTALGGAVAGVSAFLARVMQIPAVENVLDKLKIKTPE